MSLRAKAGVPKTLVKRKLRLHSLYFPHNTLVLTESRREFSDLHSILDFVRFAIDQFRYIKIQPKTVDLSSRLWQINTGIVEFIRGPRVSY